MILVSIERRDPTLYYGTKQLFFGCVHFKFTGVVTTALRKDMFQKRLRKRGSKQTYSPTHPNTQRDYKMAPPTKSTNTRYNLVALTFFHVWKTWQINLSKYMHIHANKISFAWFLLIQVRLTESVSFPWVLNNRSWSVSLKIVDRCGNTLTEWKRNICTTSAGCIWLHASHFLDAVKENKNALAMLL